MHGLSSDGSQSALLKINSKNSKTSEKSKISKNSKISEISKIVEISNISRISEISKMARPSGQDFPKHKGGLIPKFRKCPDLVDRIFQNIRADFLEILEIRKVRGKNFGNFGIEFGRADRHSSDDRPCTTTQLRGHGLSTGGATIYIYIHST